MPIIWRYLLFGYLRVFFLSVSSFVAILFVLRFKEIARFAALSVNGLKTILYILYQFPHILPLAIPFSGLIASFLLCRRLSQSHELTAMRSLGVGLFSFLTPLLLASLLLSLVNFCICAEISPHCRRETKNLLHKKGGINPIILLKRQELARMRNTYLKMKSDQGGQYADNVYWITYQERNERLNFLTIEHLFVEKETLCGEHAAILSHIPHKEEEHFDSTLLENQKTMSSVASLLSQKLKRKRLPTETSLLSLKELLIQIEENPKKRPFAWTEVLRRLSLAVSVFTFTLLGCAFGMQTGRNLKNTSLWFLSSWTFFLLLSYFLGKSFKAHLGLASFILLLPHLILWIASYHRLRAMNRGRAI